MAKPTTTKPTWATDTNYSSGPDTGTPTKVEPSSGQKGQGQVPGAIFASQWWNWLIYACGVWIAYFDTWISAGEELIYPVSKVRTVFVPALGGHTLRKKNHNGPGTAADVVFADQWAPETLVAAGAGFGGTDAISATGRMLTTAPGTWYNRALDVLRSGALLTQVRVQVTMGTSEATAQERMHFVLFKRNLVTHAITSIASADCANVTVVQIVTMSGLTETIDLATYAYFLGTCSSVNASGSDPDYLESIELTFTDPGPRNF